MLMNLILNRLAYCSASAVVLSLVSIAPSATASDGVLEINQVCAVQTGCFPGDAAGFPVTPNTAAGRSYRLTGDLVVPDSNTNAIHVTSPYAGSLSIDLGGFEITGPNECSEVPPLFDLVCTQPGIGSAIRAENLEAPLLSSVSIKNGTARGMGLFGISISVAGASALV